MQAYMQQQLQHQHLANLQTQHQQAVIIQSFIDGQRQAQGQSTQQHLNERVALLHLQQAQQASMNPQLQAPLLFKRKLSVLCSPLGMSHNNPP